MQRFVIELATSYANHCDQVIAPSASIETLIRSMADATEAALGLEDNGPDKSA